MKHVLILNIRVCRFYAALCNSAWILIDTLFEVKQSWKIHEDCMKTKSNKIDNLCILVEEAKEMNFEIDWEKICVSKVQIFWNPWY